MNHRQNPFHFSRSIGAGLNNISRGIFGMGRLGLYGRGRYGSRRTQEQTDLDVANTYRAQAETRKLDFEGDAMRKSNAARTPEALNELGADSAGISQLIYNNLKSEPVTGAHPPLASAGYSNYEREAGMAGRLAEKFFAANENPNPLTFSQARTETQDRNDLQNVIIGEIDPGRYAQARGAAGGKPVYSTSGGTTIHNYSGAERTTKVGGSVVDKNIAEKNKNESLLEVNTQKILKSQAEVKKLDVQTEAGGFAPPAPKAFSKVDKEASYQLDAAIARQVMEVVTAADEAADLSDIDPETLSVIKSIAKGFYVDPGSDTHNNMDASVRAAIKGRDPRGQGFEGGGFWSGDYKFKDQNPPAAQGDDDEYTRLRKQLYPDG